MNFTVNPKKGAPKGESRGDYLEAVRIAWPHIADEAANIIAAWYDAEDALDDYDDLESLADHMRDDIYDMIDGCDSESDKKIVIAAIEGDSESRASEASGTGNLKGRKNIADAINRGYIFEALDTAHELLAASLEEVDKADEALAGCREQLDKLDELRAELNKVGAAALRADIAALYSPEHARWAARDKMLKEAVKLLYGIFGDLDAGREMVLTYTSSLATNAKRVLLQNQNAVEVSKQDLKDNGLTEDSAELVTFTKAAKRQANATMAKTLKPLIDQAKVVAEAAGTNADATVPASEYVALLDKLKEMYENASKISLVITTTPDFKAADVIKQLKTAPDEAKVDEGFLDKLIDMFKKLGSSLQSAFASLKKQFMSLFGEVERANDTYAKTSEILMTMGFAYPETPTESKKDTKALKGLGLKALESQVAEVCKKLENHPDFFNFADEIFFVQENCRRMVESATNLRESLETLQSRIPVTKNEDNMAVIGVLADAITQIAADSAGEGENPAPEGEPSVGDQVSAEYAGEPEEPEEPAGGEELPQ